MADGKYKIVDDLLGTMTLEEKVGQLFVFGLNGSQITPDLIKAIAKYNCAGIRVTPNSRIFARYKRPGSTEEGPVVRQPKGVVKDLKNDVPAPYLTLQEYATVLNQLKTIAINRPHGIPVHIVLDQEGNGSADLSRGGIHYFPHPMGLCASGDPDLVYRVGRGLAEQMLAVGVQMIHSPVLDVNLNPLNPEIGTRSYSDNPLKAATYAAQTLKGFRDGGLIATAKHFPGRGDSVADAHYDIPRIEKTREQLWSEDLLPYQELIPLGLPAIMLAHTIYPAYDGQNIATFSRSIIQELIRKELGFQGVITTDSITMGAVEKQYPIPQACVMAVKAGVNLILLKDENWLRDEAYQAVLNAVKSGEIKENWIDGLVETTLKMKVDYGHFNNGGLVDVERIPERVTLNHELADLEREAAERSVLILRDREHLLPLAKDRKVLLVEQIFPTQLDANDSNCHPGMLWEEMLKLSDQVMMVDTDLAPEAADRRRVMARVGEADLIIATNYYVRAKQSGKEFIQELAKLGKPLVVVTNTPYIFGDDPEFSTVVLTFSPERQGLRGVARLIFGELQPTARLEVKL